MAKTTYDGIKTANGREPITVAVRFDSSPYLCAPGHGVKQTMPVFRERGVFSCLNAVDYAMWTFAGDTRDD